MLITIGSFDGFHKGHRELFRLCRSYARENDWAVITFSPHPAEYMRRLSHALFTLRERELLRKVLDIPNMFALNFDDAFMNLHARDFWELVRNRFDVDGLVTGSDFRFGRNAEGTANVLADLAKHDGITNMHIVEIFNKPEYSSSNVRKAVTSGDIQVAQNILGCPYFMMSRVIAGNQRGRKMNFPTANLDVKNRMTPKEGVYAAAVLVNGSYYCGAVSIGNNPTFDDVHETRLEIHILDFAGDIYGAELPVFFLGRIRDMHTFSDKQALVHRINTDIEICRTLYAQALSDNETRAFLERAKNIYTLENLDTEIIRLV